MDTNGNYIQNQFCSYEIALKLKNIGFDEECFGYFRNHDKFLCLGVDTIVQRDSTLAPLWQNVIDWLFDKYKFIVIERRDYYRNYNGWYYEILKQENEIDVPEELYSHDFNFDTRFEAREAAILKAIELCKERKN